MQVHRTLTWCLCTESEAVPSIAGCTASQTRHSRPCASRMKTAGRLRGWRLMCLELACSPWSMQVCGSTVVHWCTMNGLMHILHPQLGALQALQGAESIKLLAVCVAGACCLWSMQVCCPCTAHAQQATSACSFNSWVHCKPDKVQQALRLTHEGCWPSAWLAADVPGARLLSLEYAGELLVALLMHHSRHLCAAFNSWVHCKPDKVQQALCLRHDDCWPSAWLAVDVPGARLLSLEYAGGRPTICI